MKNKHLHNEKGLLNIKNSNVRTANFFLCIYIDHPLFHLQVAHVTEIESSQLFVM